MKKKYIKLQVECMQIQHENHLLAGSGNENDHADSKEFQSDFEADFDNFDDDDINTSLKIIRSYGTISYVPIN